MNKKPDILYLRSGSFIPKRTLSIKKELEKLGEKGIFGLYDQIKYYTDGGKDKRIKLFYKDIDLKDFRVIFFRTIGSNWQIARLMCQYLEGRIKEGKVKIVDPAVVSGQKYLAAKLPQTLVLKKAGLPVPKTFYGKLESLLPKGSRYLSFPMIVKRSMGNQGKEVYLAKDREELSNLIDRLEKEGDFKKFLAQEFIPNQGDLRLYVLGKEVITTVRRMRVGNEEFRNNLSQGGEAIVVKPKEEIEKIALQAAEVLKLGFAGVDIALRKKDEFPFILEVNRSPGYTSTIKLKELGVNISRRIAQYLIRLKKQTS